MGAMPLPTFSQARPMGSMLLRQTKMPRVCGAFGHFVTATDQ